ncbi:PREDICTED: uncharacterized protein LOC102009284 [Chinchilla lanigera]|uniref:uncharacterized protein LOC102009284 n=1 Tax=Chinchilla lanigera TaxID=34839 RepID=UPI00038E9644|nr:PREDICTED: uncharacterized protein LOC102009284 [Chinchilla lanigera]
MGLGLQQHSAARDSRPLRTAAWCLLTLRGLRRPRASSPAAGCGPACPTEQPCTAVRWLCTGKGVHRGEEQASVPRVPRGGRGSWPCHWSQLCAECSPRRYTTLGPGKGAKHKGRLSLAAASGLLHSHRHSKGRRDVLPAPSHRRPLPGSRGVACLTPASRSQGHRGVACLTPASRSQGHRGVACLTPASRPQGHRGVACLTPASRPHNRTRCWPSLQGGSCRVTFQERQPQARSPAEVGPSLASFLNKEIDLWAALSVNPLFSQAILV